MSGTNIVLDTNIVFYLLNGDGTLGDYLQDKTVYLSFVTELETLGYKGISTSERASIVSFLHECSILDINQGIKDITVQLRSKYAIKLPDAIVVSTAIFLGIPLITADTKLEKILEATIILYEPHV